MMRAACQALRTRGATSPSSVRRVATANASPAAPPMATPSSPPPTATSRPTSAARPQRVSHWTAAPTRPPPSAPADVRARTRCSGAGRFGERQPRADAGAAQRAAAGADHRQHRRDRERGGAARGDRQHQPADGTGGDPGQGAARGGAGPSGRGEPCRTPPAQPERFVRWRQRPDRCGRRGRLGSRRRGVVLFLDHVGMDELVAVARDRADEARLPRVVAERAADGAHGLAERALRHDDVGPGAIEDLAAMHRLAAPLDQQEQEIEVPGDERHLAPVPEEEAPLRRQRELTEAVSDHGR